MNADDIIKQITSGEVPTGAMGGGGVIALLVALKAAKGALKFILIIAALALLAGAASAIHTPIQTAPHRRPTISD